jgi:hypothetical protein
MNDYTAETTDQTEVVVKIFCVQQRTWDLGQEKICCTIADVNMLSDVTFTRRGGRGDNKKLYMSFIISV